MTFAQGDPFVSGSLLSYQQALRMMTNFRGASVPSNLQAGALWSDSDDDRLWHQGASLDEVFTEQTTLTWENLISNSGFGYWPQSDASKGLATITYDQGAKGAGTAPSVGDAVVGGTSGATAKVISYTIATGTWDAGTATGVVTVGAVSHDFAFVDNETITFGGVETAVVNMPDSADQVGLLQNGGFAAATTGWSVDQCTIASIAGGKVGNCCELTRVATASQIVYQPTTVEVGKIYKVSVWVKSGTSGNEAFVLKVANGGYFASVSGTTTGAWVLWTLTVESPGTSLQVTFEKFTATAGTMLFDEMTCYEITPCCTAGDNKAFDGWAKDTTVDIYRQHNDGGTLTKDGSFYALKFVPSAVSDFVTFPLTAIASFPEWYQQFAGRTVTLGAWIKTSAATHARIRIIDSAANTYSGFHTGGGDWEWLEVTQTINAATTSFNVQLRIALAGNVDGTTIVYVSQPILVLGSHIGEGNYQPKPYDFIWGAKKILSNAYNGLLDQSDLAFTDLNIEADSDAMIPKGAKMIALHTEVEDSGSGAGLDVHLELRKDATAGAFYCNSVAGKPNDIHSHDSGLQPCDVNGDVDIHIDASGASTFDIVEFEYHGVQVN